jgi:hypothetical protein
MVRVFEEEYQGLEHQAVWVTDWVTESEARDPAWDAAALERKHEQEGDALDASRGILLGLTVGSLLWIVGLTVALAYAGVW